MTKYRIEVREVLSRIVETEAKSENGMGTLPVVRLANHFYLFNKNIFFRIFILCFPFINGMKEFFIVKHQVASPGYPVNA